MEKSLEQLLREQYKKNNYRIIRNQNTDNKFAYIYFSSNALYKNGSPKDFEEKITKGDRYEWSTLKAKTIPAMEIFVRDIFLSWYVNGINEEINNYEKLVEFLGAQTDGFMVRCVGASSGGYIGNIVASKLEADISYCFAGQFSLQNHHGHLNKNPYLNHWLNSYGDYWFEYYKWPELKNTNIVYCMSAYSEQDIEQYEIIEGADTLIPIKIDSNKHGVALMPSAIPSFLSLNVDQCRKYVGGGGTQQVRYINKNRRHYCYDKILCF